MINYGENQIHPCMDSYAGRIERTNPSSISLVLKAVALLCLQLHFCPCKDLTHHHAEVAETWTSICPGGVQHSAAREPLLSSRVVGSDPGQHDNVMGCP